MLLVQGVLAKLQFLFLLFLCLLIFGCTTKELPHADAPVGDSEVSLNEKNRLDKIIKRTTALNAEIDVLRESAEKHDTQLKMYRQEIQRLREHLAAQTGEGRKDLKAHIQILKNLANQQKKARNRVRLMIQVHTERVKELAADFYATQKMLIWK
ncbi:hypothetical protein F4Z98_06100 [Candidatus Poribacteria bacterium]|nr:hypothetical protein [Candidatus Poribacteria bacterium]MYB01748.1 hypothetical protein [Candidatus Poribacteria bacterium]